MRLSQKRLFYNLIIIITLVLTFFCNPNKSPSKFFTLNYTKEIDEGNFKKSLPTQSLIDEDSSKDSSDELENEKFVNYHSNEALMPKLATDFKSSRDHFVKNLTFQPSSPPPNS